MCCNLCRGYYTKDIPNKEVVNHLKRQLLSFQIVINLHAQIITAIFILVITQVDGGRVFYPSYRMYIHT